MTDLQLCRICLNQGVKLYSYDQYNLKQYYEQIMNTKLQQEDGLPRYLCYMCASLLHKYHQFKYKCDVAHRTLTHLRDNAPLTIKSISQIDRQSKKLKYSIDIITVNENVKTYYFKYATASDNNSSNDIIGINNCDIKNVLYIKDIKDNEIKLDIETVCVEDNREIDCDDDRTFNDDDQFTSEDTNHTDKTHIKQEPYSDDMALEDDKIIFDVTEHVTIENEESKKRKVKRNTRNSKGGKKFEVSDNKKNILDPEYWLKISLTEEEALEEMRVKAKDPKYLSAPYKCTGCVKGFSKEDMLNRHVKLRHSESLGPVECRFCGMRFKWKSRLSKHITQHYAKYKCLRCNVICALRDTALTHNAFHNGVIRKCTHCGEIFRHSSTYYTHLRTHRSAHVCAVCGASFTSTTGLNIHKRMHVTTVISDEERNGTHVYCEPCDIQFETRAAYQLHLSHSNMHPDTNGDQSTESPAPTLKQRKKSGRRNPRKLSTCSICNKTMPSYTAYMRHHAAEHSDLPFPKERHICEICGASVLANSVSSHVNTHTRERLFECPTCHMSFSSKRTMTRHQLTHTGEKPYGCPLCDKRFTQVGSMKLHYRTFHLKEPYPKRNRRKKAGTEDEPDDTFKFDRWR